MEKRTDNEYCKEYVVLARSAQDDTFLIEVHVTKQTRVPTDPHSHWNPADISYFAPGHMNVETAEAMVAALNEAVKRATLLDAEVR